MLTSSLNCTNQIMSKFLSKFVMFSFYQELEQIIKRQPYQSP